jgi:hypothetical protein
MSSFTRALTVLCVSLLAATACSPTASVPQATPSPSAQADLADLHRYVVTQAGALYASIGELQQASDRYYQLAQASQFDYPDLWASSPAEVQEVLSQARTAFLAANPQYERMEGVVAGVPSLSQFDVILDAGTSGADGSEDAVPFDLILPDGRVLAKPGNLFEVTEATLWGSDPAYTIAGIQPDFNGNGMVDLGEALPDANVLKGAADAFEMYAAQLVTAAQAWQPNSEEAFGALVANVPTFSDFMESWKNSRFVRGEASTERGFVATSRLSDLSDNILSWQKIYAGLSPAVKAVAPDQDAQITYGLASLQQYVSDLYAQESQQGKQFTPEEADMLNAEGQDRAVALAGQIAQAAAQLGIPLDVE